jgi:hypothetical protein
MFVLLLFVNALFAEDKVLAHHKNRSGVRAAPFQLIAALALPESEMHDAMKTQEDSVQTATLTENLMRPRNLYRTGAGKFMGGMIGNVTAVAIPVQQFIYLHSSYDSGANEYSWPAVHIRPNIRRGSAWMSVQLRF